MVNYEFVLCTEFFFLHQADCVIYIYIFVFRTKRKRSTNTPATILHQLWTVIADTHQNQHYILILCPWFSILTTSTCWPVNGHITYYGYIVIIIACYNQFNLMALALCIDLYGWAKLNDQNNNFFILFIYHWRDRGIGKL